MKFILYLVFLLDVSAMPIPKVGDRVKKFFTETLPNVGENIKDFFTDDSNGGTTAAADMFAKAINTLSGADFAQKLILSAHQGGDEVVALLNPCENARDSPVEAINCVTNVLLQAGAVTAMVAGFGGGSAAATTSIRSSLSSFVAKNGAKTTGKVDDVAAGSAGKGKPSTGGVNCNRLKRSLEKRAGCSGTSTAGTSGGSSLVTTIEDSGFTLRSYTSAQFDKAYTNLVKIGEGNNVVVFSAQTNGKTIALRQVNTIKSSYKTELEVLQAEGLYEGDAFVVTLANGSKARYFPMKLIDGESLLTKAAKGAADAGSITTIDGSASTMGLFQKALKELENFHKEGYFANLQFRFTHKDAHIGNFMVDKSNNIQIIDFDDTIKGVTAKGRMQDYMSLTKPWTGQRFVGSAFVTPISGGTHESFVSVFASHLNSVFSKSELTALSTDNTLGTLIRPSINAAIDL